MNLNGHRYLYSVKGKMDALASLKALRENGSISKDVILIFDEMYLQKSEELAGGELVGSDKDGELYKVIVSFMIVGLADSIPFVIKALPSTQIDGEWVMSSWSA